MWKIRKIFEPKITAKDLERLITQATNDLKEYDVERHEKFKEYEMQKALEEELKVAKMNELEKKAYQQEEKKRKTAHKKQAQNLPHPVSFWLFSFLICNITSKFDDDVIIHPDNELFPGVIANKWAFLRHNYPEIYDDVINLENKKLILYN